MIDLKRFYSEIQRGLKHIRLENTNYDGLKASKTIEPIFLSFLNETQNLARFLFEYWIRTYIETSKNLSEEPTTEHVNWLANILTLFDGSFEADQTFSKKDWEEIRDLTESEAEDIPIDVLQNIMSVIVERKVL